MFKIIKENKWKALVSSIIILIPMFIGLILWNKLPDSMATHFGADGNADGFGSKTFTVFVIPLIMLALHWICLLFTSMDPGNKSQNKKALGLLFWILPMISLLVSSIMYGTALGKEINMEWLTLAMIALLFIVFGNYLPKINRNSTLGIKIPWTLNNDENWNKTHRLGGKLWVSGGFILLLTLFLPNNIAGIVILLDFLAMIIVPTVYSYTLYRKQLKAGQYISQKKPVTKSQKIGGIIGAIIGISVLVFAIVMMFTGNIIFHINDKEFSIEATYYTDITVAYGDIDSIEFREQDEPGSRTNGWGSARLSMGIFENDEFGSYTRYSYTSTDACIVLKDGEDVLVLSGANDTETKELYEKLADKIEK